MGHFQELYLFNYQRAYSIQIPLNHSKIPIQSEASDYHSYPLDVPFTVNQRVSHPYLSSVPSIGIPWICHNRRVSHPSYIYIYHIYPIHITTKIPIFERSNRRPRQRSSLRSWDSGILGQLGQGETDTQNVSPMRQRYYIYNVFRHAKT